jgi:hypothetical protein
MEATDIDLSHTTASFMTDLVHGSVDDTIVRPFSAANITTFNIQMQQITTFSSPQCCQWLYKDLSCIVRVSFDSGARNNMISQSLIKFDMTMTILLVPSNKM